MIRVYNKKIRDDKSRVSSKLIDIKGSFIYCVDPSFEEKEDILEKLGIDSSLIRDALDPYEVPRLEEKDNLFFVISSFPVKAESKLLSIPFGLAVGANFVAVISSRRLDFLENWFTLGENFVTTQKTKLVNLIFKKLMGEYSKQLAVIDKEFHRISLTPGKISSEEITKLVWFEESLNLIIGDLVPTDAILRNILSGKKMKLFDEDKELIEDTVLYTEQLMEMVRSNLMKITNLRGVYSALLTDNLNNTMKLLAAITVVLTIPTIVASIYGMNITLPLQNHPFAFAFVILFILLSSVILIYLFIKNKWF